MKDSWVDRDETEIHGRFCLARLIAHSRCNDDHHILKMSPLFCVPAVRLKREIRTVGAKNLKKYP